MSALSYRIGLDLGVASVGWAVLAYEGRRFREIVDCGSRIVPQGTHAGEFKRGDAITKNQERRQQRSARRLRQRFKHRRENLRRVLVELGVPIAEVVAPQEGGPLAHYALRARAIDEEVTLVAFGRLLWRLNSRRGYQSNRNERAELARSTKIEKRFVELAIASREPTGQYLHKKPEYRIRFADGTDASTTDQALLSVPDGATRELELTTKTRKNKSTIRTVKLADAADWGNRLASMDQQLRDAGQTPGQYFAERLRENPHYRVRQRLVYRARYVEEFERLWDRQAEAHPGLVDPDLYERVLKKVLPRHTRQFDNWASKSLKAFVRDYILFYQRPLKSKRSTIGDCPLESVTIDYVDRDSGEVIKREVGRKVIPASHPLYQEYRTWAAVNNIRLRRDGEREGRPLPDALKARLYEALQSQGTLSAKKLVKLLPEVDVSVDTIASQDDLPGNATRAVFAKAAKDAGTTLGSLSLDEERLTALWHLLYSHNDDVEAVHGALVKNFGMSEREAEVFGMVTFARARGPYSAKAIRKLLPLMRAGDYHDARTVKAHANKRLGAYAAGELPTSLTEVLAKAGLPRSADASVAQGLPVYAALAVQYGHHEGRTSRDLTYDSWEEITVVKRHSLRNPVVERVVNEALLIVRDLWATYGRPAGICVELARELKSSKQERERRYKGMRDRNNDNDRIREELNKPNYGLKRPATSKDILRYKLWSEQRHKCVYTARHIQAADLFNGNTDIDHVLPQQRYQDDSYGNKVLTFRAVNEAKGNALPLAFARAGNAKLDILEEAAFRQNVRDLYGNPRSRKRQLLLAEEVPDDFGARALQNTRYMSKRVRELLEPVCPGEVVTTAGPVTAYLRRRWGLDDVFKELVRPRFERLSEIHGTPWAKVKTASNGRDYLWLKDYTKRIDHRHHALDAIVTAATSQSTIQRLSRLSQAYDDDLGKVPEEADRHIRRPTNDFADKVLAALRRVIVSHKPTNRLLSRSINRYQIRDPETGKIKKLVQDPQQTRAVRGQLHVEQAFGRVRHYVEEDVKKAFAKTEDIAVSWQRELFTNRLAEVGGDASAARKSLKTRPLIGADGEEIETVILFDYTFAKNRPIGGLSNRQRKEIADKGTIARPLETVLSEQGKKTPDAVAIEALNRRIHPDYDDPAVPSPRTETTRTHSFGDKTRLVRVGGPRNHWIDTGDSYALGVVEGADGERDFANVKFYDAIQRALAGESPTGACDFAIQKGETYAVPTPEGDVTINGNRYRLYVNRRISDQGPSTRFAPIEFATGLPKEFISASYTDSSPNTVEMSPRPVRNICYPVNVDRLGRLRFPELVTENDIPR